MFLWEKIFVSEIILKNQFSAGRHLDTQVKIGQELQPWTHKSIATKQAFEQCLPSMWYLQLLILQQLMFVFFCIYISCWQTSTLTKTSSHNSTWQLRMVYLSSVQEYEQKSLQLFSHPIETQKHGFNLCLHLLWH